MNVKTVGTVEYPISRIKSKIQADEAQKYMKSQQQKLPASMKLFEGDKVDLPPAELVAGDVIKNVTVGKLIIAVYIDTCVTMMLMITISVV